MKRQTTASGGVGLGRGGRMSRQCKRDAVLRLLRGEDLETLSRALGVTAATLSGWQDTFLSAGEASLAMRSTDGEALERVTCRIAFCSCLLIGCGARAPGRHRNGS
jgi:transposase